MIKIIQLTETDRETLSKQSDKTLAEWWCIFNRWKWVPEIADEETAQDYINGRRNILMKWIQIKIGYKACLREWNIDKSEEEFEKTYGYHL